MSQPAAERVFAGVLAAGHGARFASAGVRTPKALVTVAGRSLLLRTLEAFAAAGHERVAVVVNEAVAPAVREHLESAAPPVQVDLTVKTTASTLETFSVLLGLARDAGAERFLLTTVDAVTGPGELRRFGAAAVASPEPLVLGVAPVEPLDQGPLRVALEPSGRARLGRGDHATAGFYAGRVGPVHEAAGAARGRGIPSLRIFLTEQAERSVVKGIVLDRALDVDTPDDVALAERALASWKAGS